MGLHEDLSKVYPPTGASAAGIEKLVQRSSPFINASMSLVSEVDSVKNAFDPGITEILGKLDDLAKMTQERGVARQEIDHYKKKIMLLANEALNDTAKQAKAESNLQK